MIPGVTEAAAEKGQGMRWWISTSRPLSIIQLLAAALHCSICFNSRAGASR